MTFDRVLGSIAILIGLVTLLGYLTGKGMMSGKKQAMVQRWGPLAGVILHFTTYVVVPIVAGTFLVLM